jgi:hypothetical protein
MLKQISESAFKNGDPLYRVVVHDHPRKFAVLQLPDASHALTLCWRSDLVDPVLVSDPSSLEVWIGVDQRLVCVSMRGNTLFSVSLSSPLLDVTIFKACIVALCEIQILVVNRDYTLRAIFDLKEIAEAVDVKDDKVIVTLIDGEKQEFLI